APNSRGSIRRPVSGGAKGAAAVGTTWARATGAMAAATAPRLAAVRKARRLAGGVMAISAAGGGGRRDGIACAAEDDMGGGRGLGRLVGGQGLADGIHRIDQGQAIPQ